MRQTIAEKGDGSRRQEVKDCRGGGGGGGRLLRMGGENEWLGRNGSGERVREWIKKRTEMLRRQQWWERGVTWVGKALIRARCFLHNNPGFNITEGAFRKEEQRGDQSVAELFFFGLFFSSSHGWKLKVKQTWNLWIVWCGFWECGWSLWRVYRWRQSLRLYGLKHSTRRAINLYIPQQARCDNLLNRVTFLMILSTF